MWFAAFWAFCGTMTSISVTKVAPRFSVAVEPGIYPVPVCGDVVGTDHQKPLDEA